jgi:hypothetical protein
MAHTLLRAALLCCCAAAAGPPRLNLQRGTDAEGRRTATVSLKDFQAFEDHEDEARFSGETAGTKLEVSASNGSVVGTYVLTSSLDKVNDVLEDVEILVPTTNNEGFANVTFLTTDKEGRAASRGIGLGVAIEDVLVLHAATPATSSLSGGVEVYLDAPGLAESVRSGAAWACVFDDIVSIIEPDGPGAYCVAPPGNASVSLALRSPSAQLSNAVPFAYRDSLDVLTLEPRQGSAGSGVTLTVADVEADAADAWRCRFGAITTKATAVVRHGYVMAVRCVIPPGRDEVAVSVAFDGGLRFGRGHLFTYVSVPVIRAATVQSDRLLLTGTGFENGSLTCRVDGINVEATYMSATEASCAARAGVEVAASNDGRAFGLSVPLETRAALRLADASPRRASSCGGEVISVTGSGFTNGVDCVFGEAVIHARVVDEGHLECVVPARRFDEAVVPAPFVLRHDDLTSAPVAFYYYAAVRRNARLRVSTFPLDGPAAITLELETP